ncbi:MAG: hypothetical protein A2648_01885 [Candidatus Lloydbacteria bacterium RIFCSPHIGHO2_01_FULL_41_20]|uniref:Uncharacterized protein n=1 Tax=Candidatus Lloydbacteria bacterium RIFCSPHIGHO2_01_FULL_41_20 TaxID=1798657 RepID=A0A1G2CQM3_9BACT|nr:MAG: hypothetical protein A2648_01885 [Candidatus Lloydbacteria bacterium RIFCSPHIGHO2_01_FULL_41_20]
MRPIFWGIILFLIGVFGWLVSVIFNVLTLGEFKWVSNFFGVVFLASLPVAIVFELIRWFKRKK